MTIIWKAPEAAHPARDAARKSIDAVSRRAKDEWLALFAEDAVVQDPVGPSPLDETGEGHHGIEAISSFWDKIISQAEGFEFTIRDSFAAGAEVANIGTITTFLPGNQCMDTDGVFVYRVDEAGKILSLRAHWEFERALTTLRPSAA